MTVQFPPNRRTTTTAEADRLAKILGYPDLAPSIRLKLDADVASHPFKLDYVNFGGDTQALAHVCLLTNPSGDRQFWLGLNIGHVFVQSMIDMPKPQRDGMEVMLGIIFGFASDLDDPKVDTFYQQEMYRLGEQLAVATTILDSFMWPNGKPEFDSEIDEDEDETDGYPVAP